jgi:DNA-binding PadR family transcriptional regulator
MKAELLILGVLQRGNFHPYEIRRRLRNAMVECYTDLDVGTLYYAVRQLDRQALISAIAREPSARGGPRTVYRITPQGRRRFQELLLEQFRTKGSVAQALYPALLFLHLADLKAVAESLKERIAEQTALIAETDALSLELAPVLSTGGQYLLRHLELQRRLDRRWLRALLADVQGGKVRDVADPKRLATRSS